MDFMPIFDGVEEEEKGSSFAASLLDGLKDAEKEDSILLSRSEAAKASVMTELGGFLYQTESGSAAAALAAVLPGTWWMKQTEKTPFEVIQALYAMVDERKETARKKAEREADRARAARLAELEAKKETVVSSRRFFGAARRAGVPPAPAQGQRLPGREVPEIELSAPVSPAVQTVLEKTARYLAHPEERTTPTLPMPSMKEEKFLSPRTKKDYERGAKQVQRVLAEQGRRTAWDMCAYLVETAAMASVSTYKRQRALLLRLVDGRPETAHIANMVRALPPYAEMCAALGREPSKRSTAITEARRAVQSEKTFTRLLGHLSPEYRDAILTLRFTGARSCEAESVRLETCADGIRVHIESAKTGARRKKAAASRSWVVAAGTPEAVILAGVLERRGAAPAPFSASALRAAWRRARVHEGLNQDSGWDLHSLRHQYAGDEKKKTAAALRKRFGEDWRRERFGKDWKSSPLYIEEYYGALAQKLGHTNSEMTKIYG